MEVSSSIEQHKKKASFLRRKRKLIIVLSVLAGIVLTLILTAQIIAGYFENKIKDVFIVELNKNLRSQVSFSDFDLSLLDRFPYASFKFYDVVALDATPAKEGVLLKSKVIALQFNIYDLIDKNYTIKDIDVSNGVVHLKSYLDGSTNYKFWNPSEDSTDAVFRIDLNKIRLNTIDVYYRDYSADQDYYLTIDDASLKGAFTDKNYVVEGDADVYCHRLKSYGVNYLKNKQTQLSILLDVDSDKDLYHIRSAEMQVGRLHFKANGHVTNRPLYKHIALQVKGHEIDLQQLLEEMPSEYVSTISNYKGSGLLDIQLNIKGLFHGKYLPGVSAVFTLRNAQIEQRNTGANLKQLSLNGTFTNGANRSLQTSELHLTSFSANLEAGSINGSFFMRNFNKPTMLVKVNAKLDLADVKEFAGIDTMSTLMGKLDVAVDYAGVLAKAGEFTGADFMNGTTVGKGLISDAAFTFKGSALPYTVSKAAFTFNNNDIDISELLMRIKNSDMHIKGTLVNVIPYMMKDGEHIAISGQISSKHIDLDELLADNTAAGSNSDYRFYLGDDMKCDVNVSIDKINFRRFSGTFLRGNMRMTDSKLLLNDMAMQTMQGGVILNGIIDASDKQFVTTQCIATAKRLDIQKVFYQLENFGQSNLTDKNLRGLLSADITYSSRWSHALTPDMNSIKAQADIIIEQGQLLNYEPMANLSRFIKLDDLMNVKFSTLKNRIDIRNGVINIPNMEIKSNAMDIKLSGTHTFNNDINYRVTLLLSDLLAAKAKRAKKENELFAEEDDGLGKTTLYILITGNLDNPKFTYDRQSVKEKIKTEFKEEKQTMKQILKEEWGLFKKDSTVKVQPATTKPKYTITWDESDDGE